MNRSAAVGGILIGSAGIIRQGIGNYRLSGIDDVGFLVFEVFLIVIHVKIFHAGRRVTGHIIRQLDEFHMNIEVAGKAYAGIP